MLDQPAADLQARHGIEARAMSADLSQAAAVEEVITSTAALDVGLLVAAAGFGTSGPFIESTPETEMEMVNLNCRAAMRLSQHFGQRFAARRRGGLVLMSSLVAFQGVPNAAHYSATKAYIQVLAEGLHQELAPLGVDVVACAPGPIASGFAARANMKMSLALKPEDVAQETLDALGRRTTVRPGWLSKVLEGSLMPLPRWGRVRIMAKVMGGMTRHQDDDGRAKRAADRPA